MSKSFRVGDLVDARIAMILSRQDAYSKQALANLRRGVGKPVGSVPALWEYTHVATDEDRADVKAETAVHLAMTQWAMHQQSKKQPMHNSDRSFGEALRKLADQQDRQSPEGTPAYRRMMALASSRSIPAVTTHARGLIGLLRASDISFDYGRWADDLYWLQVPSQMAEVQRRWGRDFYRLRKNIPEVESSEALADSATPDNN